MSESRYLPAAPLDLIALSRWLNAQVEGGISETLTARLIAGGRSNPTFELSDSDRHWILRRPPYGHVLPSAHDMSREHRVLSALQRTPVPAPRVVGLCVDNHVIGAQFYVMEKLEGRTLRTQEDTAALTEAQRASLKDSMLDALVTLHQVVPEEVGLGGWGRGDGYLQRQLDRWRNQWQASETRPRAAVDEVLRRLIAALPSSPLPGIVHGDFKIDNMMVDLDDPSRIVGVLDWEMSTLGDTLADVGILCSFWDQAGEPYNPITAGATALHGFGTREDIVRDYAQRRGVDIEGMDWYMVFADFKLAVILEGIHARHLQGQTVGSGFEGIGEMVDPLLDRALQIAAASSHPALRH